MKLLFTVSERGKLAVTGTYSLRKNCISKRTVTINYVQGFKQQNCLSLEPKQCEPRENLTPLHRNGHTDS